MNLQTSIKNSIKNSKSESHIIDYSHVSTKIDYAKCTIFNRFAQNLHEMGLFLEDGSHILTKTACFGKYLN